MITILRHLLAIALLPFTVTVVVPIWIGRRNGISPSWPDDVAGVGLVLLGAVALVVGLMLFVASLRRFATEGQGTLAPWDAPRHLVVHGPYRYVRNPMISGVIFILIGEAQLLRSRPHAVWALIFLAMNLIWIPLYEEPHLEQLFGDDYRAYRRHVRRFIPRVTPWEGR